MTEPSKFLAGKAAIVTGSTSGIGLGIAQALARAGANIVINGFGEADAIEAERAGLERDFGVKAIYSNADLSKPQGSTGLVELGLSTFGSVDILVNNAGVQHVAPVEEFPPEKWELIIALNLSSAFYTTRAALPGMKKANWGRIINIASAHGLVASPFKSAYVSAKHGIVGFTKTVAMEVAETPITVNAICPGYVKTPLVAAQIADQAKVHNMSPEDVVKKVILASQPNKRFVEVEEVAEMALYLCGPYGGSFTGVPIEIAGGWTAH